MAKPVASQPIARRGDLVSEVAGRNSDVGLCIEKIMAQLLRAIHRVDRHHHGIGTRYRIMRNNQLRAILHNDEYTIPAFNAEGREACAETFGGGQKSSVLGWTIKEVQRKSVGIPPAATCPAHDSGSARGVQHCGETP